MKGRVYFSLLILLFCNAFTTSSIAQKRQVVYVFEIEDEISEPIWHNMQKAITESRQINASFFIIKLNTCGGYVLTADSIRSSILRMDIPVFVLIDNNAASAGALISIDCDKIYMVSGSTIGAATVVTETGEVAPDKHQSYMSSNDACNCCRKQSSSFNSRSNG